MTMLLNDYKSKRSQKEELSSLLATAIGGNSIEGLDLNTKQKLVEAILVDLRSEDISKIWDDKVRSQVLELLKLLGRSPSGCDPLYSLEGMKTLVTAANLASGQYTESLSSVEALKCIANSLLLVSATKDYFSESNGLPACTGILFKSDVSGMSRFLAVRILFFVTVDRPSIVTSLVDTYDVASGLAQTLKLAVSEMQNKQFTTPSPVSPQMIFTEALKLFFNLALVETSKADEDNSEEFLQKKFANKFEQSISCILTLIRDYPLSPTNTLSSPLLNAIHALLHVPYTSDWDQYVVAKLTEALTLAVPELVGDGLEENVDQLRERKADDTIAPLLLVLRRAAAHDKFSRDYLAKELLPRESDRIQPVNKGDHISARLVRLMTSTALPHTKDSLCDLFYVLCDEDATTLSQKVGYGNAIGFLMNRNIPLHPPPAAPSDSSSQREVNPITGQFLDEEDHGPSFADMTDEEKEREAERLFVLFERLKKTGVVDVENPIAKAMRENHGRVTEIESDEDDEN
ncbi:guanine nucleotide exchange factor [Umbelopsis sp. AD052]|nr:guanine nucleotide exchange factor [Umbelopsis sp. AD052]